MLLAKLATVFRGQSIIEYLDSIGSTVLSKVIGLAFISFAVFVTVATLRDFSELMVSAFFPQTPLLVFIIAIALLASWAAYEGLETIGRMAQFLLPLTALGIVLSGLLSVNDGNIENFLPLIENGFAPIIRGGITQWAFFGETAIWLLLLPHLNQNNKNNFFMPLSVLLAGSLAVLVLFYIINALGAEMASARTYPFLTVVNIISLGGILERLESVFLIIWVASNFMKIVVFFYGATYGLRHYLRNISTVVIIIPLLIITTTLSVLIFGNYLQLRAIFAPEIYGVLSSVYQVFIPLFVAIVIFIKTLLAKHKTGTRH